MDRQTRNTGRQIQSQMYGRNRSRTETQAVAETGTETEANNDTYTEQKIT